jgi:hypothetical protein
VTNARDDSKEKFVDTIFGLRNIIFSQIDLVSDCLKLIIMEKKGLLNFSGAAPEVIKVVVPMIDLVSMSGNSLLKLTEEISLNVRDAFPIVRSLVEGVVNICYIMSLGPEVAAKAERHAEVKAYRDLKRQWNVAGMKVDIEYLGNLSKEDIDRLEAMLPEFTTKGGREKDWTDHNLRQRLDIISRNFSSKSMIMLTGSVFNIYSHASEMTHSTYFSACYFWGLTLPGRPKLSSSKAIELNLLNHQFSLFISTSFAYMGLLECLAQYINNMKILEKSKEHYNLIKSLPIIMDEQNNPSFYRAEFS